MVAIEVAPRSPKGSMMLGVYWENPCAVFRLGKMLASAEKK